MPQHRTGTREEWLAERLELLAAEKELTRQSDELARRRRELPWVPIEKDYRFETDEGPASLADLFRGRSQLLMYHFMFGPDYTAGCPACSAIADGFNGSHVHLENHDVHDDGRLARADRRHPGVQAADGLDVPMGVLARRRLQLRLQRLGDRGAAARRSRSNTTTARRDLRPVRRRDRGWRSPSRPCGAVPTRRRISREAPGVSAFALEDGVVYHTYSAYARGLDGLWSMYQWLDRAPKGRNEERPLVPPPRRVLGHSPGSSENSVLSTRRPSGFGIERTTPSRVNPARSRTRSEAVLPTLT